MSQSEITDTAKEHQKYLDRLIVQNNPLSFSDQYGTYYKKEGVTWHINQEPIDDDAPGIKDLDTLVAQNPSINMDTRIIYTQDGSLFEDKKIYLELMDQNSDTRVYAQPHPNGEMLYLASPAWTEDYYEWDSLEELLESVDSKLTHEAFNSLENFKKMHEKSTSITDFNAEHAEMKALCSWNRK